MSCCINCTCNEEGKAELRETFAPDLGEAAYISDRVIFPNPWGGNAASVPLTPTYKIPVGGLTEFMEQENAPAVDPFALTGEDKDAIAILLEIAGDSGWSVETRIKAAVTVLYRPRY